MNIAAFNALFILVYPRGAQSEGQMAVDPLHCVLWL